MLVTDHCRLAASRLRMALAILSLMLVTGLPARAQDWPTRPVRLVSPFAAGGGSDTVARIIAENLSQQLKQQFVVENRGGAGGIIGSNYVAHQPADGYTFLISSIGTHVTAPLTHATMPYDPVKSFTNVAFLGGPPTVFAVHPSLGVHGLKELLALLKKRTEPLPFLSPGPGTIGHLIGEYWAAKEKVKLVHVAYRGAGQAMKDLMAGHVKLGSVTLAAAQGQIRSKTVVPLAVTSARRMPGFADVPTFKELGYPDLVITTWFGVAAPAGLPANITEKMNAAVGKALDDPKVRERLTHAGFEIDKMSSAELTAYIKSDLARWAPFAHKLIPTGKKR